MSLRLIFNLIAISGIFSKSNDLDILPPPPPFPDIGMDEKKPKRAWKVKRKVEKGTKLESGKKKKSEEEKKSRGGKEEITGGEGRN